MAEVAPVTPDGGRDGPWLGIVIPVLGDRDDDRDALDGLLGALPDDAERIVVDGADDPRTESLCRRRGARRLASSPCRGQQLHEGALASRAAVLWFLHADAEPPAGAAEAIRAAVEDGAGGGYFGFRFAGARGPAQRLLAALINLRARFGVPYGDQALFFRREVYFSAGGFSPQPLFEEPVLVKAARRSGPFRRLPLAVGVSTRRWDRDGWLRRTLHNRLLALGYMLGASPERLAARYRRGVSRG